MLHMEGKYNISSRFSPESGCEAGQRLKVMTKQLENLISLFGVCDSFRGTSRSRRARRFPKWSFRSPSTESRSWTPKPRWVQMGPVLCSLAETDGGGAETSHMKQQRVSYIFRFHHDVKVVSFQKRSGWSSLNNGGFVSQDVQHNCQLHRISFCADDKTDKRIFTFICKDSESNKHLCYVFDSEKCVRAFSFLFPNPGGCATFQVNRVFQAEEITLTIGQAFDLAYKKFLESGGKDVETRKQIGGLQKRVRRWDAALMFLLINAELVSIDCFKPSTCSIHQRRASELMNINATSCRVRLDFCWKLGEPSGLFTELLGLKRVWTPGWTDLWVPGGSSIWAPIPERNNGTWWKYRHQWIDGGQKNVENHDAFLSPSLSWTEPTRSEPLR